ncbi:E3 ubiquitin-protein ligase RGLG2 [Cucurbita argyrosperma subsp. argyrosperma]|nr:E3 ubiquitin-protein ligase RGLG2 [Cucurbita argyrosperma subsp. argyrosperma]
MGGKSSKQGSSRYISSSRSSSQQWSHFGYPESAYAQPRTTPQYQFAPPTPGYGGTQAPGARKRVERKYSRIDDHYNSLDQVTRSVDTERGQFSSQEKKTIEAIVKASASRGKAIDRVPLPPPRYGPSSQKTSNTSSSCTTPPSNGGVAPVRSAPPLSSVSDDHTCPICITNAKDMAFGCGHQTCCECGQDLESCPICRSFIQTRIKLY